MSSTPLLQVKSSTEPTTHQKFLKSYGFLKSIDILPSVPACHTETEIIPWKRELPKQHQLRAEGRARCPGGSPAKRKIQGTISRSLIPLLPPTGKNEVR